MLIALLSSMPPAQLAWAVLLWLGGLSAASGKARRTRPRLARISVLLLRSCGLPFGQSRPFIQYLGTRTEADWREKTPMKLRESVSKRLTAVRSNAVNRTAVMGAKRRAHGVFERLLPGSLDDLLYARCGRKEDPSATAAWDRAARSGGQQREGGGAPGPLDGEKDFCGRKKICK
jgi:hypothetical protein